jgi:hypothetical protein
VVDQHLVVALRHAHCRQDRAGRVRAHQQVHLVGGDELLVQRARHVGLGLVVLDDPFDRPAEQAAAFVQLLDVDFAHQLVDLRGRRQRAGQRQRAADAYRRLRLDGCGKRKQRYSGNGAAPERLRVHHGDLLVRGSDVAD